MKILLIALVSLSSVLAFAQAKKAAPAKAMASGGSFSRPYGLAGCGLGSIVMGKDGGQISAATTNGTFASQTFGITTGTSNCMDSAGAGMASRMDQFIMVNRAQVQGDIARGQGETLGALSAYMGCSSSDKIGTALKASYSNIFDGDAPVNMITDSIITVIMNSQDIAQECQNLG